MEPLLSGYAENQRWRAIQPFVHGAVLDIGCGWSRLPDLIPSLVTYVGADINPQALDYCRAHLPQHKFYQRDLDVEPLDIPDGPFDTIILTAVLEHLHTPDKILAEIPALLIPSGRLLLTTPSPWGDIVHQLGSRVGLVYAEGFVKHVKIYSTQDLYDLLTRHGFRVLQYRHITAGMNHLAVCETTR
jgi:2-polyprenyl-3-methyl-5-hydroxy-6-metoxy-1,4-benzoquinol methylase